MNEREQSIKTYAEINFAYDLIANIRERHHSDGQFEIDCAELEALSKTMWKWRKRLEEIVYASPKN